MDLIERVVVGSAVFTRISGKARDYPLRSFLKQWPVSTHAFFGPASLLKYSIDDFYGELIRECFHMRGMADVIFSILAQKNKGDGGN